MKDNARFGGVFRFECYDSFGCPKWQDVAENVVTDVGIQHTLDVLFAGSTQLDPWYIGLTDGSPSPSTADTMTTHNGWNEITAYTASTRPEYIDSRSGNSVSNSGNKASYTINADSTVGGAFLCSDSTKGGSNGVLLCVAALSGGDKPLSNGDQLTVQYDFSGADDGS